MYKYIFIGFSKRRKLRENKKDQRIIFSIITTGSTFEKVKNYLVQNQDFKKCISNACIYCLNLEKYNPLKDKYKNFLKGIFNKQYEIENFIKEIL